MKDINKKCSKCGKYIFYSFKRFWIRDLCYGHHIPLSEFQELLENEIEDDDCIMISDVSEKLSKKIKILTLIKYLNNHIKKIII